jgi:diguanylate cyclase (GGDEF)-like protein
MAAEEGLMGAWGSGVHPPVPVTPFGPLQALVDRVHEMNLRGRSVEALRAIDAYDHLVRLAGDVRSARLLTQARMYCLQALGRYHDALVVGLRLRVMMAEGGDTVSEAKALADLAETLVRLSRLDEGLHHLARALVLLERAPRSHPRYQSAYSSVSEAARAAELYELGESAARTALPRGGTLREACELSLTELLIEWGLRLDHVGRHEEAIHRLEQAGAIADAWHRRASDSPWARALYALATAKLGAARPDEGAVAEAVAVAEPMIVPARRNGQLWEARLAHLALGIARRAGGDLRAARREFVAAEELSVHAGQPTQRLIFQYELAVLAAMEVPGSAARELLAALRAQAEHLWHLRLERTAMLRQARRRIELEEARARADEQAMEDPLTGLGNRRAFDRRMAELDLSRPVGPLVLLLVDLDRFKNINDLYSHSVGDVVLRDIAALLRAHCRPADLPVRFGGDEFAVFVQADLPAAASIGERVRRAVTARDWNDVAVGLRVTVSIGAAVWHTGMTSRQLFDAADRRLYAAKQNGRDRLAA